MSAASTGRRRRFLRTGGSVMRAARPILGFFLAMAVLGSPAGAKARALEEASAEYPDDEYQRTVSKRAALLLDRLLVALQKAVENDELVERTESKPYVRSLPQFPDLPDSQRMQLADEKTMDLQRRGQAKGRVYWRCYFNAVTCFKRK